MVKVTVTAVTAESPVPVSVSGSTKITTSILFLLYLSLGWPKLPKRKTLGRVKIY